MRRILSLILCIMIPLAMVAADKQPSYRVTYSGGSLSNIKSGSSLRLYIDSSSIRFVTEKKDKTEVANAPASAITEISYGQDVRRRRRGSRSGHFHVGYSWLARTE